MTTVLRCLEAGVLTVTLNRPERVNALNVAMHAELRQALAAAADDPAVKVVMLTGSGRAFSSGQDLREDMPRDAEGRIDLGPPLARDYNPLVLTLCRFPKPLVAALNGPAVGAAANLALACDVVVAAASATLQQAFVRIGLIPDAGGTWILPRLVGPKRALALMMTGDPLSAPEAERLGLVYRVFPDETFAAEAAAFAAGLRDAPAMALRLMKTAVQASGGNDLETQLDLEAALQQEAGRSADFAEGVAAFRAKRAPRFGET